MTKTFALCIVSALASSFVAAQDRLEPASTSEAAKQVAMSAAKDDSSNVTMLELAYAEGEAKAAQDELAAHPLKLGDDPRSNSYFMKSHDAYEHLGRVRTAYYAQHPPKPMTEAQITEVQSKVRKTLLDEDSAKFKGIGYDDWAQPCGLVNAKNSFGGYVGYKRFTVHDNEVRMENSLFPEQTSCPSAKAEE